MVLGPVDLSPLDAWLAEKGGATAVQLRTRRYAAWLGCDERSTPLLSRNQILRSSLLLNDRLFDQLKLLLASGFSSGTRQLVRAIMR
jgi:hypothetical protein